MRTTIYQCDKCGHTQENDNKDFYLLELRILDIRYISSFSNTYPKATTLWCLKCVQTAGFVGTPGLPDKEQPKPLTINDLVQGMIDNSIEWSKE